MRRLLPLAFVPLAGCDTAIALIHTGEVYCVMFGAVLALITLFLAFINGPRVLGYLGDVPIYSATSTTYGCIPLLMVSLLWGGGVLCLGLARLLVIGNGGLPFVRAQPVPMRPADSAPPTFEPVVTPSQPRAPKLTYTVTFTTPDGRARLQCGDGQTVDVIGRKSVTFTNQVTCLVRIGASKGVVQVSGATNLVCSEDGRSVSCTSSQGATEEPSPPADPERPADIKVVVLGGGKVWVKCGDEPGITRTSPAYLRNVKPAPCEVRIQGVADAVGTFTASRSGTVTCDVRAGTILCEGPE